MYTIKYFFHICKITLQNNYTAHPKNIGKIKGISKQNLNHQILLNTADNKK